MIIRLECFIIYFRDKIDRAIIA